MRGCWKLTEFSKQKNESRHQATQGESGEKERNLRDHWGLTGKNADLFLKSSAASANTSANTASINVSDTAELAQQGERQDSKEYEQEDDEEVDMDNRGWHLFGNPTGHGMGVNFTINHVIGTVQDKKLTGADRSGN